MLYLLESTLHLLVPIGDIGDGDFDYVDAVVDNLYETMDRNYYITKKGYLCRFCFYKEMCDKDFG